MLLPFVFNKLIIDSAVVYGPPTECSVRFFIKFYHIIYYLAELTERSVNYFVNNSDFSVRLIKLTERSVRLLSFGLHKMESWH